MGEGGSITWENRLKRKGNRPDATRIIWISPPTPIPYWLLPARSAAPVPDSAAADQADIVQPASTVHAATRRTGYPSSSTARKPRSSAGPKAGGSTRKEEARHEGLMRLKHGAGHEPELLRHVSNIEDSTLSDPAEASALHCNVAVRSRIGSSRFRGAPNAGGRAALHLSSRGRRG